MVVARRKLDPQLLGMRFEKARCERHLSRDDVAAACDISVVHLRHLENGTRIPSLPLFISLCSVLRVTPSYFLSDCLDLAAGLPDAYAKAINMLLKAPPHEAEIIIVMIETMHRLFYKDKGEI